MDYKTKFKFRIPGLKILKVDMPPLKIGDVTARVPIIQGGMGVGISLSGLASAVANEGGVGIIGLVNSSTARRFFRPS